MDNIIRFSIIVPIYNSETYLYECIESILSQTYNNYEVILVNDGSTDNSRHICEEFCDIDNRIRLYSKENGGQFSARIHGIKHSNGQYIIPLDSDDMIRNDTLEVLNNYLDKTPSDILIFNGSRDITYNKQITTLNISNKDFIVLDETEKSQIYDEIISKNTLNSFCMKCYSSNILKNIQWNEGELKRIRNGEDVMQLLPIITAAKSIIYTNKTLYYYRPNTNSISNKYNTKYYESRKFIYETIYSYSKIWGIDSKITTRKLNSKTLRNIVSIVKTLKYEKCRFRVKELKQIAKDEWFKKIYTSSSLYDLSISERVILFMIYNNLINTLSLFINIYKL